MGIWILVFHVHHPQLVDMNVFFAAYASQAPCVQAVEILQKTVDRTAGEPECQFVPIYTYNQLPKK